MTRLERYFIGTTKVILGEYERSKNLEHKTMKGTAREVFATKFLQGIFPKKFVIESGEIFDSEGKISKQADIIVYDELMPTLEYVGTKQFLSGGVLSHIEVKSHLNKSELLKALEVTESIKSLHRDIDQDMYMGELPTKIFSSIFAYSSIRPKTLMKHINDFFSSKSDRANFPDVICVLNEYIIQRNENLESMETKPVICELRENTLLKYFQTLYSSMYKNWLGIPDLNKYCEDKIIYKPISDL